jgi:hypothetical protein
VDNSPIDAIIFVHERGSDGNNNNYPSDTSVALPLRSCNVHRGPKGTSLVARSLCGRRGAQHLYDTCATWRTSYANFAHDICVTCQIHAGCASHPRIQRKCCAHLPREQRATRDSRQSICFKIIKLELRSSLARWSLTHLIKTLVAGDSSSGCN